jgi:hypothetical protein
MTQPGSFNELAVIQKKGSRRLHVRNTSDLMHLWRGFVDAPLQS